MIDKQIVGIVKKSPDDLIVCTIDYKKIVADPDNDTLFRVNCSVEEGAVLVTAEPLITGLITEVNMRGGAPGETAYILIDAITNHDLTRERFYRYLQVDIIDPLEIVFTARPDTIRSFNVNMSNMRPRPGIVLSDGYETQDEVGEINSIALSLVDDTTIGLTVSLPDLEQVASFNLLATWDLFEPGLSGFGYLNVITVKMIVSHDHIDY